MSRIQKLQTSLYELYQKNKETLLFHGWHHINFVSKKAVEFADSIGADKLIAEAAALTHDLNYIVRPNSDPEEGKELRKKYLSEAGFSEDEKKRIEDVVLDAHTAYRGEKISKEGMAVSDADTVFKTLPITQILFTEKYISQNKIDIYKLSEKIIGEQEPLLKKGIYFYTEIAKKRYLNWAKENINMWKNFKESLKDPDVQGLLEDARSCGVM